MLSETRTSASLSNSDWYYNLQASIEARIAAQQIKDRWFAFTRGLDEKPKGEPHKYDYLVEFFANEITGPYNQDISFLLVGNKGRGKSLAALSMCYFTACELAERFGGKWQNFFNPDRNLAVILESEANSVMAIQEKYQIKDFDDIGIGWGARDWHSKENMEKNDVFQINRTDNTLQVFTVPNQFLLDKVPRSLVSHYGEMYQQFFAHGFTTIKIFEPETLFREGRIIQPYLNVDRTKYVLFRVPKPPQDLTEFYNKKRRENKTKATECRLSDGSEEPAPRKAMNPQTIEMEHNMMAYADTIAPLRMAGLDKKEIAAALVQAGLHRDKAKRWANSKVLERLFPGPTK